MVVDLTHATGSSRQLSIQRRAQLRSIVESRRGARLDELSSALGVSQATVRRDLDQLAAEGKLLRVRGGAMVIDQRAEEILFNLKTSTASEQKELIAARAVELLSPSDTIYLDSGSTLLAVARLLHSWDRLTVVTNNLPVAMELVDQAPQVIVIGGQLRSKSQALVGPLTQLMLDKISVDRALMGTFALSLEGGLMTTDPLEAYTKELVLVRARQVILLADSSKIGTRSLVHVGRLEAIDVFVTDSGISEGAERGLVQRGIQVIKA